MSEWKLFGFVFSENATEANDVTTQTQSVIVGS